MISIGFTWILWEFLIISSRLTVKPLGNISKFQKFNDVHWVYIDSEGLLEIYSKLSVKPFRKSCRRCMDVHPGQTVAYVSRKVNCSRKRVGLVSYMYVSVSVAVCVMPCLMLCCSSNCDCACPRCRFRLADLDAIRAHLLTQDLQNRRNSRHEQTQPHKHTYRTLVQDMIAHAL